MSDPYQVVRDFESALCEYTGAKYAVTTNSCTMALLLAVAWHLWGKGGLSEAPIPTLAIEIPSRTYVSVPMSIIHAGGLVSFQEEIWSGAYQLWPLPVWDCARRFTTDMYEDGSFQCVSFHASKILGDTQGGAILHDDDEADAWFRRARFDGRTEGIAPHLDRFDQIGWHCYMSNDVAARLLLKLHSLPKQNNNLPNDNYPDLSKMEIFK